MPDELRSLSEFSPEAVFGKTTVPPELEQAFLRHRENVLRLVDSLRQAGLSEEEIDNSVSAVVASYKEELLRTIKAMAR